MTGTEVDHTKWLKGADLEEVQQDEEDITRKIGEAIHKMQTHNFDAHQHWFRGTHVKSLGFVKGTLTVPSLPQELQYGLFSQPGTYTCIARYANEPSFIQPDTENMPRGLGLKVFGVKGLGPRLEEDGLETQDFLFNNAPIVELRDAKTTLEIVDLRQRHFDDPAGLKKELAKRSDAATQFAPAQLPVLHVVSETMYTQSAFSHGPYAVKYSLQPTSTQQKSLEGQEVPKDASNVYNRTHLTTYFSALPATYTLRAQFATDRAAHPVEDAATEWTEESAPWVELATLEFPKQDSWSDERRTWWEDKVALSPWDGLEAHRPLGSINRLRKHVYKAGRGRRAQGNAKEVKFPVSADEVPE